MNVLYEDNHLLVIDKPAGLLVQGGDRTTNDADDHLVARASAWLKAKYDKPGNVYLGLVHRLDRNTSGIVVLAKTSKAATRLAAAFAGRDIDKRYLAVVAGITPASGALEHWLAATDDGGSRVASPDDLKAGNAKLARLSFTTVRTTAPAVTSAPASWLLVQLESGRKHQIRAQLAAAGHALLGDRRYAPATTAARFDRPALHAWSVALTHPVRGDELRFVAPLPDDFSRLIAGLGWQVTDLPKIDA